MSGKSSLYEKSPVPPGNPELHIFISTTHRKEGHPPSPRGKSLSVAQWIKCYFLFQFFSQSHFMPSSQNVHHHHESCFCLTMWQVTPAEWAGEKPHKSETFSPQAASQPAVGPSHMLQSWILQAALLRIEIQLLRAGGHYKHAQIPKWVARWGTVNGSLDFARALISTDPMNSREA